MIAAIVAFVVVSAGAVGVLQFFLALDRSPQAAVEATWFAKAWRWCTTAPDRFHERIDWARLERNERAAARWSAEIGYRTTAQRLSDGRADAAAGDADPSPATHSRVGPQRTNGFAHENGDAPPQAAVLAAAPAYRFTGNGRAHWVWLTRPEFYAEPDGSERLDLDPSTDHEPGGWWRCDAATRRGDLAVMYRTAPRKDLRYLVEVQSDAYPLGDHRGVPTGGHGCDYRVLHKLDPPLSLADLRADPVTAAWAPVRLAFQQGPPVPPAVWERLATLIAERDARAGRLLRRAALGPLRRGPLPDGELASRLFEEPQRLQGIGLDLEAVGRRIRHPHGGVLDIVFRDKANGDYVVVAVRPGRGTRAAVARLLEDVASVSDLYHTPRVARGVLVATDLDQRAELMLRGAGNLEFARLGDLGLSVEADARSAARPA